mmetsp:Transcript_33259/g.87950  ORF Transcript_33259/g.87950 Transcript_33259/m.87950 type:complete len:211 (+) Transcript_33259:1421-2053(+)
MRRRLSRPNSTRRSSRSAWRPASASPSRAGAGPTRSTLRRPTTSTATATRSRSTRTSARSPRTTACPTCSRPPPTAATAATATTPSTTTTTRLSRLRRRSPRTRLQGSYKQANHRSSRRPTTLCRSTHSLPQPPRRLLGAYLPHKANTTEVIRIRRVLRRGAAEGKFLCCVGFFVGEILISELDGWRRVLGWCGCGMPRWHATHQATHTW